MSQAKRGMVYLDAPTSYGGWIDDCQARVKRGEKQLYCGDCGKWRWPGECEHDRTKMLTRRQLMDKTRLIEKGILLENVRRDTKRIRQLSPKKGKP